LFFKLLIEFAKLYILTLPRKMVALIIC